MSERGSPANLYAAVEGDVPSLYDRVLGPVFFVDFADDIARRTAASTPLRVLETAAGTGIVSRRLRDLLPAAAQLTVTDLNPAMLDMVRGKFAAGERVDIEPADAAALPFPDGGFEALVCQFGLMFLPDKEKGFREAHRVLARDGRYLFSVWDSQRHNPIGALVTGVAAAFFPADPPRMFEVPYSCQHIDPIKDGLHEAGFRQIRVEVLSLEKTIPGVAAFARALVHGSPLIAEIRARGGVDPERVIEALREALPREFGTPPTRMPLQAIVFEARRR
jgi:ubiquinone/menaquinone biosynthesis C-methylase UbiE